MEKYAIQNIKTEKKVFRKKITGIWGEKKDFTGPWYS